MLNKLEVKTSKNEIKQAVIASLICKKDRFPEDIKTNKAGWWGDGLDEEKLGSYLWTLEREILSHQTADEAKRICLEALQWLKDDGIIETLEVNACIKESRLNIEVICS